MSSSKRNFGALASAMMVGGVAAIGFAGTVHATVPVTCGAAVVGAAVGAAGWAFPNQHAAFEKAAETFLPGAMADAVKSVLDASAAPATETKTVAVAAVATDTASVGQDATSAAPASLTQAVPTPPPVAPQPAAPTATDSASVAALKAFAAANGLAHLVKEI